MRVRWLIVGIAAVLVAAGCSWNQFRHGADHTGNVADKSISVNTVSSLVLDWTAPTSIPITGSPAVVGGKVYIGDEQQYVHAFDATGSTNCTSPPKTCSGVTIGIAAYGVGRSSPA